MNNFLKKEAERRLTVKQKKFADAYIKSGNGTKSAEMAGYKKNSASVIASQNLKKLNVMKYISDQINQQREIAEQGEILEFLTKVMRDEEKEEVIIPYTKSETYEIIKKRVNIKDRVSAAKELQRVYDVVKRYEFEERKIKILEQREQDMDEDIQYVIEDEEDDIE